jgi:phage replication-related protein YjqB (UPF0714/DUF867 family)
VTFNFNSELYADPNLAEGVDYARRYRRHERFDDTLARTDDVPKTTILAPHGGGIEPGTSRLMVQAGRGGSSRAPITRYDSPHTLPELRPHCSSAMFLFE